MKKLIAILAVFAVFAGAAFAQDGSWSVGGSGNIGTRLFLEPLGDEGGHVYNRANGFNNWQGDAGDVKGSLSVNYSKGGLSAGLSFGQGGAIGGSVSFSGDNLNFSAGGDFDGSIGGFSKGGLWGNYTFDVLNGLKLEVAVKKEPGAPLSVTGMLGDPYTHHNTVTENYLYLDLAPMDGLNVGLIVPQVFALPGPSDFLTESLQKTVFAAKYSTGPIGASLQFALLGRQGPHLNSDGDKVINEIDDLQAGLYLGLSYSINDQMSAGLAFKSEFGGDQKQDKNAKFSDATYIGFGASFNFNDGPFGAGLTVKFEDDDRGANFYDDDNDPDTPNVPGPATGLSTADHNQKFSIDANVSFDLVENYLKFILGAGFTFKEVVNTNATGSDPDAKWENVIDYSFEPQLYFNFLGTGTGDYWGTGTGICVKYRVEGPVGYFEPNKGRNDPDKHYLQITFRWGF